MAAPPRTQTAYLRYRRVSSGIRSYRFRLAGEWLSRRVFYVLARIVADIWHYCDRHEIDWNAVTERAEIYYAADQMEDGK